MIVREHHDRAEEQTMRSRFEKVQSIFRRITTLGDYYNRSSFVRTGPPLSYDVGARPYMPPESPPSMNAKA